jgi:hypothetical protein
MSIATKSEPILIYSSKKKLLLVFFASLIFFLAGLWLIFDPLIFNGWGVDPIERNILMLIFGLAIIFSARKFSDHKPGFIIDDLGLHDNTSVFPIGLILWSDILEVSIVKINGHSMIKVSIRNPSDYISKQPYFLIRWAMKFNNLFYKSPIVFMPGSLNMSSNELYGLINNEMKAHDVGIKE